MNIHASILLFVSLFLFNGNLWAAAMTSPQEASEVRVETNGNDVTFYFGTEENNGKWNVATAGLNTGCATDDDKTLIWIKTTNVGKKEILSVVLTAISSGKKLVFRAADNQAACSGSGQDTYFAADYVLMK